MFFVKLHQRLPLLALFFALAGSAAPAALAADPPQPPRTEIKSFYPFGGKGLVDALQISEKVSGKCFATSAASPTRPDAWRCSTGNAILDPCYQRIMGDEK